MDNPNLLPDRTSYEGDGSLIFEVEVDGLNEISWWVLGYGDQAQVLEPPELRDLIAEHARRMLSYYDSHSEIEIREEVGAHARSGAASK